MSKKEVFRLGVVVLPLTRKTETFINNGLFILSMENKNNNYFTKAVAIGCSVATILCSSLFGNVKEAQASDEWKISLKSGNILDKNGGFACSLYQAIDNTHGTVREVLKYFTHADENAKTGYLHPNFQRMYKADLNKDGYLTPSEIVKAFEEGRVGLTSSMNMNLADVIKAIKDMRNSGNGLENGLNDSVNKSTGGWTPKHGDGVTEE
ncbi:hypothetical protein SAMN04488516_1152 [Desulfonauticus submarinus]|uniref:EF-hand domain-containing protein n=1 Tax=Desulfonauticus submarinus TaxID=206665 RepID=A0A1H0FWX1_9BACT|nr:hypothetical protein [Desulfonauticus submarinus]SDN99072.1 hypothetical protein SAMN04488516_1152 [Desulfonauticus submarinus]